MKSSSLKSPSDVPMDPVVNNVSNWLSRVNTSQTTKSLLDEEDVMSTVNYGSTKLILGYRALNTKRRPGREMLEAVCSSICCIVSQTLLFPYSTWMMRDSGSRPSRLRRQLFSPTLFSHRSARLQCRHPRTTPTRRRLMRTGRQSSTIISRQSRPPRHLRVRETLETLKLMVSTQMEPISGAQRTTLSLRMTCTISRACVSRREEDRFTPRVCSKNIELEPDGSDRGDELHEQKQVVERPDLLYLKAFYAPSSKSQSAFLATMFQPFQRSTTQESLQALIHSRRARRRPRNRWREGPP